MALRLHGDPDVDVAQLAIQVGRATLHNVCWTNRELSKSLLQVALWLLSPGLVRFGQRYVDVDDRPTSRGQQSIPK